MKFILGQKSHMTQKFLEDGTVVGVTAVKTAPNTITQIKGEKDGYNAVQIGYGEKNKLTKSLLGHLKGLGNIRHLQEFRVESTEGLERGKQIAVDTFEAGDKVKVSGISKGKGFQGVVKRHGFKGSLASHGHKDQLRMPGSIGATGPAHVFKGVRMPGRMGGDQVTTSNVEVVEVNPTDNIIYVKGAVPGARNAFVWLQAEGDLKFVSDKKEEAKEEVKAEDTPVAETTPVEKVEDKAESVKEEPKVEEKKEETPKEEAPKEEVKEEEKK